MTRWTSTRSRPCGERRACAGRAPDSSWRRTRMVASAMSRVSSPTPRQQRTHGKADRQGVIVDGRRPEDAWLRQWPARLRAADLLGGVEQAGGDTGVLRGRWRPPRRGHYRDLTQRMLVPAGRHHGSATDGEGRGRRVTKRTVGASHDRHLCAHGVNRSRSAAVTCSRSRCTLLRIMNSSFSSRRRSEAGCRVSCRSP